HREVAPNALASLQLQDVRRRSVPDLDRRRLQLESRNVSRDRVGRSVQRPRWNDRSLPPPLLNTRSVKTPSGCTCKVRSCAAAGLEGLAEFLFDGLFDSDDQMPCEYSSIDFWNTLEHYGVAGRGRELHQLPC